MPLSILFALNPSTTQLDSSNVIASPWKGNSLRAGRLQTSSGRLNWWYKERGGWVSPGNLCWSAMLAEMEASAKSVWLITTDAPRQVFRVRSSVPGLEGQTIAPVPHKIAHSCIFNEAQGQMVWNYIIQYLAVLRQRKSGASITMLMYLQEKKRKDRPSVPLTSAPLHSPSPQDHLGKGDILGTQPIYMRYIVLVWFLSTQMFLLNYVVKEGICLNPLSHCSTCSLTAQLRATICSFVPRSSSELDLPFSDISCRKLKFNARGSLPQITPIQIQCVYFSISGHLPSASAQWMLYILHHILE